ncbi:hypothetical protein LINPERPRIM_LOCUS21301 [Linum perenne]
MPFSDLLTSWATASSLMAITLQLMNHFRLCNNILLEALRLAPAKPDVADSEIGVWR